MGSTQLDRRGGGGASDGYRGGGARGNGVEKSDRPVVKRKNKNKNKLAPDAPVVVVAPVLAAAPVSAPTSAAVSAPASVAAVKESASALSAVKKKDKNKKDSAATPPKQTTTSPSTPVASSSVTTTTSTASANESTPSTSSSSDRKRKLDSESSAPSKRPRHTASSTSPTTSSSTNSQGDLNGERATARLARSAQRVAKPPVKPNPICYLDFQIGDRLAGRVFFELFKDAAPKAVENFRALCTGEKGKHATSGTTLHYKDSNVHRVVPGIAIEAGDLVHGDGTGDINVHTAEPTFCADENALKHTQFGTLSTASKQNASSQFVITLSNTRMAFMDARHTVFGRAVRGAGVLRQIEHQGSASGALRKPVRIVGCGRAKKEELQQEVQAAEAAVQVERAALLAKELHQRAKEERQQHRGNVDQAMLPASSASSSSAAAPAPSLPNEQPARDVCEKCQGPLKYVQRTKKGLRMRCKDVECGHAMYVAERL